MAEKSIQNMLDYIGDRMDALDFDGDLNLNWDKEAHVFEVELTMYVEATSDYEVEDQNGDIMETDDEIEYSDALLFYDETRIDGESYADNYLFTLGFSGKKGIEKAKVDALFVCLQNLLDEGQSDLFDFVDGTNDDETFALTFDQEKYQAAYEQTPVSAREVFLPYPKY